MTCPKQRTEEQAFPCPSCSARTAHGLPSPVQGGTPAPHYQEKVALHGVTAAEGDLEHGAFTEQSVRRVYYVILEAQALVHLPEFLQPLLETGGAPSAEARQGPPTLGRFAVC